MWAIVLILVGVVLKANPAWFNGAALVGGWCIGIGVALVALWLFIVILAVISR
jgi:hypothetical protein